MSTAVSRENLAVKLASGLSGWYQLQTAQGFAELSGEDAAQLIACQIVRAEGRYTTAVSQTPTAWPSSKKRIDIALLGRTRGTGWYGGIEMKWATGTTNSALLRPLLLADLIRVCSIDTSNLNARFLVLGGRADKIAEVFAPDTKGWSSAADGKKLLATLLPQDPDGAQGSARISDIVRTFDKVQAWLPPNVPPKSGMKLNVRLLAQADSKLGGVTLGRVLVWQCNYAQGSAH
jgi:hypothetical protein